MKRKLMIIFLAILAVASFGILNLDNVYASLNEDCIYYVSLGDSIAVGYNLPEYDETSSDATINESTFTEGVFVKDSYSYNIKQMLEDRYGINNVNAKTLAKSGDTCENLLEKLNNVNVILALQKADFVTICIGANDILGPALANIDKYIKLDSEVGSVSIAEMENALSAGLAKVKGDNQNVGKFNLILNKLYEINSSAKYIFTTIYNPYKYFAFPQSLETYAPFLKISTEKVNKMGEITEVYLDGGTNSQSEQIEGLNKIIKDKLEAFNKDNFVVVNSKEAFDEFNLSTNPKYNELVYAVLTKDSTLNLGGFSADIVGALKQMADPHPTELGHSLIYNKFISYFNDNLVTLNLDYSGKTIDFKTSDISLFNVGDVVALPNLNLDGEYFDGWYKTTEFKESDKVLTNFTINEDLTLFAKWVKKATVEFNTNGGSSILDQNVVIGEKLVLPDNPTKNGYAFMGWYSTETFEENSLWDFENLVEQDIILYAKWARTYSVTFNSNGGNYIPTVHVVENEKISKSPMPTKLNSEDNIFAGWKYGSKMWDFENDIVTSNITLVAQWVTLNCENSDNLHQISNQITTISFSIQISNAQICWYVNENLQQGQQSNTFSYTPAQTSGTYEIYCIVNGVKSKSFTIKIEYYVPTRITLNEPQHSGNEYKFSVENGEYYNPNKIIWYKTRDVYSTDVQQIGFGSSLTINLTNDCYVYAVYDGNVISERIEIIVDRQFGNELFLIVGAVGAILCVTVVFMIISKRRYNKYY